jgi:Zn-dependent metalloprotease
MKKGLSMDNLHPIVCGVIPPHILKNLAEHSGGDEEIRHTARATLVEMERLRAVGHEASITAPPNPGLRRNVYDGGGTERLPGKLVRSETSTRSTDVSVNEAFDGSGYTYDFFSKTFGRNSLDGRGMRLDATVHYGRRFDNAFWNGRQMIYGDGDGLYFTRFTKCREVIGHEHTHGLVDETANFVYYGQPGALNEHYADAFGMMIKLYSLALTAGQANWLIGDGAFTDRVKGKAIRSMAAPGTAYDDPILGRDPQPAHMSGYVETTEDNGGVHINSGILNKAFYLGATAIGGRTDLVMAPLWFQTLIHDLTATTTFQQFADAITARARSMFGKASMIAALIAKGFSDVGLPPRT